MKPITVSRGETLLAVHTRLKGTSKETPAASVDTPIRFTLGQNPLCELADGEGNVIEHAKLVVADAQPSANEPADLLSVYPNPVSDILNIEYLMDLDGLFRATLVNLQGIVVAKTDKADSKAGLNKAAMDLRDIPNGAYLLKVSFGDILQIKKVIVNR